MALPRQELLMQTIRLPNGLEVQVSVRGEPKEAEKELNVIMGLIQNRPRKTSAATSALVAKTIPTKQGTSTSSATPVAASSKDASPDIFRANDAAADFPTLFQIDNGPRVHFPLPNFFAAPAKQVSTDGREVKGDVRESKPEISMMPPQGFVAPPFVFPSSERVLR